MRDYVNLKRHKKSRSLTREAVEFTCMLLAIIGAMGLCGIIELAF